ncbi:hypothetical protein PC116_g32837, partial [Phytophthora cactorum]
SEPTKKVGKAKAKREKKAARQAASGPQDDAPIRFQDQALQALERNRSRGAQGGPIQVQQKATVDVCYEGVLEGCVNQLDHP